MKNHHLTGPLLCLAALITFTSQSIAAGQAELKNLTVNGGLEDGKARLVIEAELKGTGAANEAKTLYATTLEHAIYVASDRMTNSYRVTIEVLQGDPKELIFSIHGEGLIRSVASEQMLDWSLRQETNGVRSLVVRLRKADKPPASIALEVSVDRDIRLGNTAIVPMTLVPAHPALFHGYVKVETAADVDVRTDNPTGLVPVESQFLPAAFRGAVAAGQEDHLAFRFQGAPYVLPLRIVAADPEARRVVLRDFKLAGDLSDDKATFALSALAVVKNPRGASLALFSGDVALSELAPHPDWNLRFEQGQFVIAFDKPGEFPVRLQFHAAVRHTNGWNSINFRVSPSALQPVTLHGLPPDTQFDMLGSARPERVGDAFVTFLPPDGSVDLQWKEAPREAEGRLFFSAEMLSQISVGPGLMRQLALLDFKIMQGELRQVILLVRGEGSVTRVQGANILSWQLEPVPNQAERRLVIQFNQAQKDSFSLHIHMQTELGAFPQPMEAMRLRPEGAIRFAGHFRVVNEGAVRLEILQATGLSQVSPEQFPESDATKALFGAPAHQRFVFRFSAADVTLRIQADNVLPEVTVSQLLNYHLGETELAVDAEFELDIREAPLRELLLRVPRGFAIARLQASELSDYFLTDNATEPDAQLRLVYGQPASGRQVVQLRLERNGPWTGTNWTLPRLEVARAKSTRGHVGVSADAGFRLTPDRTKSLTEIATAFFPRRVVGLQAAFRLSDPAWEAAMRVERLPQSIQADVFHLFSIGEGIGYGSSTINYLISGAPVSTLNIDLSAEYFNVEFTGKDIRNWQKTAAGYAVQLHTPVSGTYTLLASYERPFKAKGDTLTFTGARPLDAQTEQGFTIIVSTYQFQVTAVNVSPGLTALETAEVPAEYRLFFDAPILAAYRYSSRPFNLQLGLSPLAQGDTLSLVVDRAVLSTRISKSGEVVTDARYFVKNRGNPHFRIALPPGTELWSATVNNVTAVPVKDGNDNLVPLSPRTDPNAIQVVDLKLASRSPKPERVAVAAPIIQSAPVLLAQWRLEPDTSQRLIYRRGSLAPAHHPNDGTGFAALARLFGPGSRGDAFLQLGLAAALVLLAVWAWRWAARSSQYKYGLIYFFGTLIGLAAFSFAAAVFIVMAQGLQENPYVAEPGLSFLAPIQQAGTSLSLEVANVEDRFGFWNFIGAAWPVVLALVVWIYAWLTSRTGLRSPLIVLGWVLLAWATLRWPNVGGAFFLVVLAYLIIHIAVPALQLLWRMPRRPAAAPVAAVAPAVSALLLCGWMSFGTGVANAETPAAPILLAQVATTAESGTPAPARPVRTRPKPTPVAESVTQEIRVEERFAFSTVQIRWQAVKDQLLPVLYEPGVLTQITYPSNALRLVQTTGTPRRGYQLRAQENGTFDIRLQYQLPITGGSEGNRFVLPTQHGLVNKVVLTVVNADVDLAARQAVSVERTRQGSNTVFAIVLAPVGDVSLGWKPRTRDLKGEKPLFYAEMIQLYAPSAGVIEGAHQVQVRPAQGQLEELIFDVPGGATITDVIDPAFAGTPADAKNPQAPGTSTSLVSLWRFDPDTRKLRVTLAPPQSRAFTLLIRSQVAGDPQAPSQTIGLLTVNNAAGQLGLLGIATGSDIQLDNVTGTGISPINLEDFPAQILQSVSNRIAGLTLRRAFRYADPKAAITLATSAVEPDIRVEAQQTLSLGEDRIVLAANLTVSVTRAGIFRLSFLLPANLEVESISGPQLSHWTELKAADGRIVTLHLKGKTEGQPQFALTLSGPGTKAVTGWNVPRLLIREATKQTGQLFIVPEQGMRLQVATREGVTQLDPQKAGIRQKGVLGFRLLQGQATLTLDIEQVDPWVQVSSLQHVVVTDAPVKTSVNLQYQIENTGLKSLRVRIPTNAESVRFRGEHVSDFLAVPGQTQDGMQTWEIKLHRRVMGRYLLQATFQNVLSDQASNIVIYGVQALDVNLQRGFVTLQAEGRRQVRMDAPPAALQPTEWQSIPRVLRQDLQTAPAHYTFRLVEPAFQFVLHLERHDAARLLAARVNSVTLTSVISDEGAMLTQVRLEIIPGDKRLLPFTLPPQAQFWFAFVNQNGVWPWREQDRLLIPLEKQAATGKPVTVELLYSSRAGPAGNARKLDLELAGPKFDLPLENITWHVYLNEKWKVHDWAGSLQLQDDETLGRSAVDVQTYLRSEATWKADKSREAEELLVLGNTLLETGQPQHARRAYQAAYGLSTQDDAFNEDARVQLHNLKLQQALMGLNVRQATVAGEADPAADKLRQLRGRKDVAYTQQEAKSVIEANTAEENEALMRLAERLVQQQDASASSPTAIRASVPEQGRLLTFRRPVQVDVWTNLHIHLEATATRPASIPIRFVILVGILLYFFILKGIGRTFRRRHTNSSPQQ